jgi:hypothetical protein
MMANMFTKIKDTLAKAGMGLMIAAAISIVGGIAYLIYQHAEHDSAAKLAAAVQGAHDAGVAETQRASAEAANASMLDIMKQVQALTADTNAKMAKINIQAQAEHKAIDTYDADAIAVAHPEEVEAWANKTTGDLFSTIATDTALKPETK